MQFLDRVKRWLRLPRSYRSVVTELAEGLRDGSIVLGHEPAIDEPQSAAPGDEAGPTATANGHPSPAGPLTPEPNPVPPAAGRE